MYTIRNAAPRAILRGIRDESGRTPVIEPEMIPTHLPHAFLFAERGPTLPQLVSGDKMITTYGRRTFDYRGPYANHQTVLVNTVNGEGNELMLQRIIPLDANPPAALRLYVEVAEGEVQTYVRGNSGRFLRDSSNVLETSYIDKVTGTVVEMPKKPGLLLRWFVTGILANEDDAQTARQLEGVYVNGELLGRRLCETVEGDPLPAAFRGLETVPGFGDGEEGTGSITNGANSLPSKVYPIADFLVADIGSYGNRVGFKLSAPTTSSAIAVDADTIEEQLAYLFRISFIEKDEATSTPLVLDTLYGGQHVDFTLKEGTINERLNKELYFDSSVLPSYSQEAAAGLPEIRAPFGDIHLYTKNILTVLEKIQSFEAVDGTIDSLRGKITPEFTYLINPFSAEDYNAIPYETIRILGPGHATNPGILLNQESYYYCQSGYDGTMDLAAFDERVGYQLEHYGDLEAKFLNTAVYPQSVIYDTGFSSITKEKMMTVLGRRKDMYIVLSPQDVSLKQNDTSSESSIAVVLKNAARLYPESVVYGTSVCRAIIIGQSGYLLNSVYKKLLPLTIEYAQKCARYMGAGTGMWKKGLAPDMPPNNRIMLFKGVNNPWVNTNVRGIDWDNGLSWAQSYDRRSLFWPGIQTVYDDDSSVLNSALNVIVAVELEKVAERVWRDLAGISYLTPDQFIARSDALIKANVAGKFDARVVIVPETFYTSDDDQRGYSWSCNIHMYAPNMKTVGTFTIVAHRIEDL